MLEGGTDVVDGGLAFFWFERCGFEENVGASLREPFANSCGFRFRFPAFRGRGRPRHTSLGIKASWICVPAQAAGGDSGDAESDAVAIAEFGFAVGEQADERSVDVAEAEKAEVVSSDVNLLDCILGTAGGGGGGPPPPGGRR